MKLETKRRLVSFAAILFLCLPLPLGLTSCDDGPLENAAEEVEDAGEEVVDEIEDLGK